MPIRGHSSMTIGDRSVYSHDGRAYAILTTASKQQRTIKPALRGW